MRTIYPKLLVLALLILSMAIPYSVQAATYDLSVELDNKNPNTWARISDSTLGTLQYNVSGAAFSYLFTAEGLEHDVAYSLIYYANPHPGNNPGCIIGTGKSSATTGTLTITGTPNLNMSLPTPPDSNMITDHSVAPDNYSHAHGAKIWLVPSECYDSATKSIKSTGWQPTRFLFETDLITYTDTDLEGGTEVATTTTITEPVARIGMTVEPISVAFGNVQIGSDSDEQAITLENTGNVDIKATATTSAGFYTDCMQLKPDGGFYTVASGWVSPVIPVGDSLTVYAKVHPTIAYSGTVNGSLTFIASFAP